MLGKSKLNSPNDISYNLLIYNYKYQRKIGNSLACCGSLNPPWTLSRSKTRRGCGKDPDGDPFRDGVGPLGPTPSLLGPAAPTHQLMSHTVNATSLFYIPDSPEILTPHTDFRVIVPIVFSSSFLCPIFIISLSFLFVWQFLLWHTDRSRPDTWLCRKLSVRKRLKFSKLTD